jgi:hypothetical protein
MLIVKIISSKITAISLLLVFIVTSIIEMLNVITKDQMTLGVAYFSIIISVLIIIFSVLIQYIINLYVYRFIIGQDVKRKIVFFNFLLLQMLAGLVFELLNIFLIKGGNSWLLLLFNPLFYIVQYIFYLYLINYEQTKKKATFIYIILGMAVPILFRFIKVQ